MKIIYILLLFPFLSFCQVQVGQNINGQANDAYRKVSLSADGSIMAIGTAVYDGLGIDRGLVKVFKKVNATWVQCGNDIVGEGDGYGCGFAIDLSDNGDTIAICYIGFDSNRGLVKVFKNINDIWTQIGNPLMGLAQVDMFGASIDLSSNGNILAINAPHHLGGQVIVFQNINNIWVTFGQTINAVTDQNNPYGESFSKVSLSSDGNILAIGCTGRFGANGAAYIGCLKIFQKIGNNWIQIGSDIEGIQFQEQLGRSVCLSADGNFLVASAPFYNGSAPFYNGPGQVRSYQKINNNWSQVGNPIDSGTVNLYYGEYFGNTLSLSSDGSVLAIGSNGNTPASMNPGIVKIYKKDVNNNWVFFNSIYGHAQNDLFGSGLSLSADGNFIAVGAPGNDENGNDAGQVSVYDLNVLNNQSFTLNDFSIYPNPTKDIITIVLQENLQLEKVNIYTTLGQLIKTENNKIINVTSFSKGFYFFEVVTDKGKATRKILVE